MTTRSHSSTNHTQIERMNSSKVIVTLLDGSPDSNRCIDYLSDCKCILDLSGFGCSLLQTIIKNRTEIFHRSVVTKENRIVLLNCIERVIL